MTTLRMSDLWLAPILPKHLLSDAIRSIWAMVCVFVTNTGTIECSSKDTVDNLHCDFPVRLRRPH